MACLRVLGLGALLSVTWLKSLAANIGLLPFVERLQLFRCRRSDSLGSFLIVAGEGRVGGCLPLVCTLPPDIVCTTCGFALCGVSRLWFCTLHLAADGTVQYSEYVYSSNGTQLFNIGWPESAAVRQAARGRGRCSAPEVTKGRELSRLEAVSR